MRDLAWIIELQVRPGAARPERARVTGEGSSRRLLGEIEADPVARHPGRRGYSAA